MIAAAKRNRIVFLFIYTCFVLSSNAQISWKIAGDRITTNWAAMVDPKQPLPEYPRPQMQRTNWTNLNGLMGLFDQTHYRK